MTTLYTLPAAFGLRNPSPFCLKIEMALTHLKIDFEIVTVADPRKAPKGKLPWLVDGAVIPDSELILEHLDKKTNGGLFGELPAPVTWVSEIANEMAEPRDYIERVQKELNVYGRELG